MKELADGTMVIARTYYYLLDFNDQDRFEYIQKEFNKKALCELTIFEFLELFDYAVKQDRRYLTKI